MSEFQGEKFVRGREGGDYYSGFYVDWLEAKLEAMKRLANEFAVHRSYCSTQSNSPGQRQLPLECDCGYEVPLHLAAAQKE